jgi:TRAP-type C4-dicarboxylate transport system permease small subunit
MRVLLVTFLLTLLFFAISLLLGILGVVIAARLRALPPNMSTAYRYVALPVAAAGGAFALVSASVMEIRRYRQTKALAEIERISEAVSGQSQCRRGRPRTPTLDHE